MFSIHGDKEAVQQLTRRLRQQRLHRNWTQAHVAGLAGISLPTYMRLEKGEAAMSLDTFAKVMGVLGFAERLSEVVPEVQIVDIEDTVKPQPQRARVRRKRKPKSHGQRPA